MKKVILKKRFFKPKSPSKFFMRQNIDDYFDAFKKQKGDSEKNDNKHGTFSTQS